MASSFKSPTLVPYIDEERDNRDQVICEALSAAIQLIADDDANRNSSREHLRLDQAVAVIRLARNRLSISSNCMAEIDAEVSHG